MYQRDTPKLPIPIPRNEFVELVFDIGYQYMHGYDSIVSAVQIGDYFVSYTGQRSSYCKFSPEDQPEKSMKETIEKTFMDELVPQVYSVELAYVVTVLSGKYNEDFGYRNISRASFDTENSYVMKMEREIFEILWAEFRVYNFITIIGLLVAKDKNYPPRLARVFFEIAKDVCMDQKLLSMNPWTVVIGIILLGRAGKLKAVRTDRERIFWDLIQTLSAEYDLDDKDILNAYIKMKS